jgi:hypothetical protein
VRYFGVSRQIAQHDIGVQSVRNGPFRQPLPAFVRSSRLRSLRLMDASQVRKPLSLQSDSLGLKAHTLTCNRIPVSRNVSQAGPIVDGHSTLAALLK